MNTREYVSLFRMWLVAAGIVCIVMMAAIGSPNPAVTERTRSVGSLVDRLNERASWLLNATREMVDDYEREALPIERLLRRYSDDSLYVRRITVSIVRHARVNQLDPALLAGVLLVENPWLKPDTTSFVGAVGLMQVMPMHAGQWGCESHDLTDVDANICHGARILAWNLARSRGDVNAALLRYNGCVRGDNTPDCSKYPQAVKRHAYRVRATAESGFRKTTEE